MFPQLKVLTKWLYKWMKSISWYFKEGYHPLKRLLKHTSRATVPPVVRV